VRTSLDCSKRRRSGSTIKASMSGARAEIGEILCDLGNCELPYVHLASVPPFLHASNPLRRTPLPLLRSSASQLTSPKQPQHLPTGAPRPQARQHRRQRTTAHRRAAASSSPTLPPSPDLPGRCGVTVSKAAPAEDRLARPGAEKNDTLCDRAASESIPRQRNAASDGEEARDSDSSQWRRRG
jgi:hypothetical protein